MQNPTHEPTEWNFMEQFGWLLSDLPDLIRLAAESAEWAKVQFSDKPGEVKKKEALDAMLAGFDLGANHIQFPPGMNEAAVKVAFSEMCSGLLEMVYQTGKAKQ